MEITSAVLLFPLVLPIWRERPLTRDDLFPEPVPVLLTTDDLRLQQWGFREERPAFRQRMARALGDTHHPEAARLLLAVLERESDPEVIATILSQLRRFEVSGAFREEVLARFLEQRDAAVRVAAVQVYGRLPDADAGRILNLARNDTEPLVRRAAWRVLAERSDWGAPALPGWKKVASVFSDNDALVRAAAGEALLRARQTAPREVFERLLRDDHPAVRCVAARRLDRLPAMIALAAARRLTRDPDPAVRAETAASCAVLGAQSLPLLARLCRDEDADVRREAVASCGGIAAAGAVELAAAALGDSSSVVRGAAVRAVARLHSRGVPVLALVRRQCAAASAGTRGAAYRVLGVIGARSEQSRLLQAVAREARNPAALAGAIFACGRLGIARAVSAIAEFADHSDWRVRKEVAEALGRLGLAETSGSVAKLACDPVAAVRRAALRGVAAGGTRAGSKACLAVLLRVQGGDYITADDRAAACWSAGRVKHPEQALVDRLVTHATTPVIPTAGGKMFDAPRVLVSAMFALVQIARGAPEYRGAALKVISVIGREPSGRATGGSDGAPVFSPALREYARQAAAWLDSEEVRPRPRPPVPARLPLSSLKALKASPDGGDDGAD